MEWKLKKFEELTLNELYDILQLRSEVFVVEQKCIYHDPDSKDKIARHLVCYENNKLIAYTRILPPGISYQDASIGRVVTAPSHRNTGLGKELMQRSIAHCEIIFNAASITLGAQVYLIKFYESLGFSISGKEYIEDEIPHISMTRKATS
jgi:ElaA protein